MIDVSRKLKTSVVTHYAPIIAKVKAKTTEDLRQKLFGGLFLRSSSYQKEVERSLYELNR